MEQLKILNMIGKWGYLNTYQIGLLLNKNFITVDILIRNLVSKKLLWIDQLTRKNIYVEFEITRKTKERFESKLDSYYSYLKDNNEILWVVPDEKMKKFVKEQIKAYDFKTENQHIEIFRN